MNIELLERPILTAQCKAAILGMLRDARAIVYRDSESFSDAVSVLEHIGQMLQGTVGIGLDSYKKAVFQLAENAPPIQHNRVKYLFDTVRKARNDSVHSGTFIRHHAIRLVELFLILEEGISMSGEIAADLMVQNPTIAEPWHNIAAVRRTMLINSFSFLPVLCGGGNWKLVSDFAVMKYLRQATPHGKRGDLLGKQLQEVLESKEMELTDCRRFFPDSPISEVANAVAHFPVLIVEKAHEYRLLGIMTAFDLL